MQHVTIITLLASGLWLTPAHAQSIGPDRLQTVRVTGVLVSSEARPRGAFRTVSILVHDKPWLLQISDAQALSDGSEVVPDTRGEALPQDIRFTGPDALMRRLQKDHQLGRPLTIEGQLDAKERWFRVTAVEEDRDVLLPQQ